MTPATLKDVAQKAQLSVTQVSRALNGHDDVSASTRELARKVAAELNYTPNINARRLQDPKHRAGTIGIILANESLRFSDPFFGDLLSAMVLAAASHDLQLQLSTHFAETDPLTPYEDAIRGRRVDGFVLLRTLVDDTRVTFLQENGAPFVTFGQPENGRSHAIVDSVADSLAPVVRHLVELGHRRIACLAEPPQFAIANNRLSSFAQAVEQAPQRAHVTPRVVVAGFHEEDGLAATRELLSGPHPPTAIVALNDLLALGAMRAVHEEGLSVPEDLSVVGFDDISAASLVRPGLTTMRLSAAEVGQLLIDELHPLIEARRSSSRQRLVTPELVVRGSTGPARG